jgi:hypothetical protein
MPGKVLDDCGGRLAGVVVKLSLSYDIRPSITELDQLGAVNSRCKGMQRTREEPVMHWTI